MQPRDRRRNRFIKIDRKWEFCTFDPTRNEAFPRKSMKNRIFRSIVAAGSLALVMAAMTGCESCKPGKPGPIGKYGIEVRLDDPPKTSSVIVDVVGVNALSLPGWEAYDMGKYWKEGDA